MDNYVCFFFQNFIFFIEICKARYKLHVYYLIVAKMGIVWILNQRRYVNLILFLRSALYVEGI